MQILGICGRKQSGKDATYDLIKEILQPNKVIRIAFADCLKEEVAKACGVTVEYIEKHKEIFRPMLQWWGTEFRRNLHSDTYWITKWVKKVIALDETKIYMVVVPDVRFINEANAIKEAGGQVIKIERPLPNLTVRDYHPSENDLICSDWKFDDLIINNGTLADLQSFTSTVLFNLQQKLKHDRDIQSQRLSNPS